MCGFGSIISPSARKPIIHCTSQGVIGTAVPWMMTDSIFGSYLSAIWPINFRSRVISGSDSRDPNPILSISSFLS
uniref:Uncharacterized protein n=1 Tax=Oryza nivara TaxID=4536 RepID=A0A0E0J908_ORYNI